METMRQRQSDRCLLEAILAYVADQPHSSVRRFCNAGFRFDGGPLDSRTAGEMVRVPSPRTHGFRTGGEGVVILYIWRGGDMRKKSTFA